ncbi:iron-containing alcohol dehydrogenase [Thermosipho ferrireducens]|uniref:Iron-containing alcohol dehydrogenase n=1 Tax=Thermosipho ferrireducens TaxID=2571116 RepID=A0ABX7SAT4_9BACT|nr:iron-containing alcohol dehydrogenase family protein [Thermosipho ferrireducens]QTA38912.1 iron-containing alcohol dehydrogenase [Thermosipho ferrireducens]
MPTKFYFENAIEKGKGELVALGTRFLIITGQSSRKNGSLEAVIKVFKDNQKYFEIFDQTEENPSEQMVKKIIETYGKNWDVVVGLGGGSPMDAAKAVAVLCKNEIEIEDLYNPEKYSAALPIVCIPTTSGTGSEVTQYSVLTVNGQKKGFKHETIFPKLSFIDPVYTLTMPEELTLSTGLDALSHAIESAVSKRSNPMSELYSFKAIEIIKDTLPELLKDLSNYELRKKIMFASTLAGISISITGTTIAHALGYSITTEKGIRHGLATAVFLPFELQQANTQTAKKILEMFDGSLLNYFKNIGVKISFPVSDKELETWTERVSKASHVAITPGNYNREKIYEAYLWLIEKSGLYGG